MPKVSIIIPFRNESLYIKDCIQSIQKSTFTDFEIIAIDDCSTDNSYEIVKQISSTDHRVHVYKNKNGGLINALGLATSKVTSEYITRMDADDLMDSNKLSSMLEALQNASSSKGIAVGKVSYFHYQNDLKSGYKKYEEWLNSMIDNQNHFENIYTECVIPSIAWMMKTELFQKIGGFGSRYPEDYDFAFRVYENQLTILPVNKTVHYWRDHPNRASRNDENYLDQNFFALKLYYFKKLEYNNNQTLVLYGAGKKGKVLAKIMQQNNLVFEWWTDNENKIGHEIYGINLKRGKSQPLKNKQIILSISSPSEKEELHSYLTLKSKQECNSQIINFF